MAERRFIPACAGNTLASSSAFNSSAVHPRVCGEHIPANPIKIPLTGSSPRVRGTRRRLNRWK